MVALIRVIALLGFGWLADVTGVRPAILVMAGIAFVGTLAATIKYPELWQYRSRTEPPPEEGVAVRQPAVAGPLGLVMHYLETHTDTKFVVAEQRWLNAASLLIIGVGWVAVLVTMPVQALGIAVVIAVAIGGAGLVRVAAQRLKPMLEERERRGGGPAS
jgi:hypothetical protein